MRNQLRETRRTSRRHLEAESFTTSLGTPHHYSLDATFSYKETICKTMAEPAWPYRSPDYITYRPPSVAQFFARLRLVRRGQPQNGLLPSAGWHCHSWLCSGPNCYDLESHVRPTLSPRPPKTKANFFDFEAFSGLTI